MRRSQLRKVIHKVTEKLFYFHQWTNDPEEEFAAVLEDENGNISIINYGQIQFLPDPIDPILQEKFDGTNTRMFVNESGRLDIKSKNILPEINDDDIPLPPKMKPPKEKAESDSISLIDDDDNNDITKGLCFSRKK